MTGITQSEYLSILSTLVFNNLLRYVRSKYLFALHSTWDYLPGDQKPVVRAWFDDITAYLSSGLMNHEPSNFQPAGSMNLSLGSLS